MIKYTDNKFEFYPILARFMSFDEPQKHYTDDKKYYEVLAQKWWHVSSLQFYLVEPTSEQVERMEYLNTLNLPDAQNFMSELSLFVEHGLHPVDDSPFKDILKSYPSAIESTLSYYRDKQKQDLASIRYDKEVGGIEFNGLNVATDRSAQAMLNAAVGKAKEDTTFIVDWKTENGFVTLDSATLIALGDVVSNHVQACFSAECKVDRDNITPADSIDALTTINVNELFEGYYDA